MAVVTADDAGRLLQICARYLSDLIPWTLKTPPRTS
jgi:hypothetical protein